MKFFYILLLSTLSLFVSCREESTSEIGLEAYRWTVEITDIGPRSPGSDGILKVREWIEKKTSSMGFTLQKRPFTARTPKGFVNMVNLTYLIPGQQHGGKIILLAHYDSKFFAGQKFVGANDAASSVALLLSLSSRIQKMQLPMDVEVAFVDGEEAFVEWSFNDSLYGSRQMVQDLKDKSKIKGVIVVDMIGDKNLSFIRSRGVDEKLLSAFSISLMEMKQYDRLETHWSYVMDDHTPFAEAGLPVLHIMDFTYGGAQTPGAFWHTNQDTMENISAESLSITGEALLRTLQKIS